MIYLTIVEYGHNSLPNNMNRINKNFIKKKISSFYFIYLDWFPLRARSRYSIRRSADCDRSGQNIADMVK